MDELDHNDINNDSPSRHFVSWKMASKGPNLKTYLEKTIQLQLNKGRKVQGTLLGYDQFMNVVLSNAVEEEKSTGKANSIGMVAIRGNSILQLELVG